MSNSGRGLLLLNDVAGTLRAACPWVLLGLSEMKIFVYSDRNS